MRKRIYRKKYKKMPGSNLIATIAEQTKNENAWKCNEDTKIRIEIHGIIVSLLNQGEETKDIINKLSGNERYKKYSMYFENWIIDAKKKVINKEERQR